MAVFYIKRSDKTVGPYSEATLRKNIKAKKFRSTDDVREGEDGQWQQLQDWVAEQRSALRAESSGDDFALLAELEAAGEVVDVTTPETAESLSSPDGDARSGHLFEKNAMGALYSVQLEQQKNTGGMRCFNCGAWVLPIPFPFICLSCKMAFPSRMALTIFLILTGLSVAAGLMLAFGVFASL